MNDKVRITGARIIDPSQRLDRVADLWVADGTVAAIGDPPEGFGAPDQEIDATGLWAVPGLVDLSARVAGRLGAETRAAAAGGFTAVCCPPDAEPVIDDTAALNNLLAAVRREAKVRVLPIGALTQGLAGEGLADHDALCRAGCVALGNGARPIADSKVMRSAMRYAASLGTTIFLYPADPWLSSGCAHDGRVATRLGLEGVPVAAETAGLARDLALIEDTGVSAHFCRLSSARAVAMLEAARAAGLNVTADVAMHQLFLTEQDVSGFDARAHTRPPLRSTTDRDALIHAVAAGTVDAICSDHTPLAIDLRLAPFAATEPGISAAETALALGLRLIQDGALTETRLIEALSATPGRIAGRPVGLKPGNPADLTLIDPNAVWTCRPEEFLSQGRNTPFTHWEFHGRVARTLVAGKTVYQKEKT